MDIVATLLILGSMVGFGICMVILIVKTIRRKSRLNTVFALGIMVALFLAGAFIMPASEPSPHEDAIPAGSIATDSAAVTITESMVTELVQRTTDESPQETAAPTTTPGTLLVSNGIRDESLAGHGHSDAGRSEPQYVGVVGYAVNWGESYYDDEEYLSGNWTVPIYEKDKQFYNEVGTIAHKTEVLVVSQELEHEGYSAYSGYLTVEDIAAKEQYIIDVMNFITKPYWTYDDLLNAVSVGHFIAEFNQVSDYYPVNKSNEKVELEDGTIVHVIGKTGTYGRNGPDDETNQIEAIVFKEWKYGYGGVSVFFNVDDLKLIY